MLQLADAEEKFQKGAAEKLELEEELLRVKAVLEEADAAAAELQAQVGDASSRASSSHPVYVALPGSQGGEERERGRELCPSACLIHCSAQVEAKSAALEETQRRLEEAEEALSRLSTEATELRGRCEGAEGEGAERLAALETLRAELAAEVEARAAAEKGAKEAERLGAELSGARVELQRVAEEAAVAAGESKRMGAEHAGLVAAAEGAQMAAEEAAARATQAEADRDIAKGSFPSHSTVSCVSSSILLSLSPFCSPLVKLSFGSLLFLASFVSVVLVVSAAAEAEAAREAESDARQEAAAAQAHKTSVVEQLQTALSGSASFEGEAEGLRRALEEARAALGAAEAEAARLRADLEAAATGAAEGLEGMRSRAEEAAAEAERLGAELEGREREVGMAEEVVRGLRAELGAAEERSSSIAAQVSLPSPPFSSTPPVRPIWRLLPLLSWEPLSKGGGAIALMESKPLRVSMAAATSGGGASEDG